MHHVGKPPELNIKYGAGQHELGAHHPGPGVPPVSLPYRDTMQSSLLGSHKATQHLDTHNHLKFLILNREILEPLIKSHDSSPHEKYNKRADNIQYRNTLTGLILNQVP